jgi:hypothetical protein
VAESTNIFNMAEYERTNKMVNNWCLITMFENTMVVLFIDRGTGKAIGNAREYRKGNP